MTTSTSNYRRSNQQQLPRILNPVSTDDFVAAIQSIIEQGGEPQLLLFLSDQDTTAENQQPQVATRNVASNEAVLCLTDLPKGMITPTKGMETYITSIDGFQTGMGGKPHSEFKGMMDDWHGARVAMNILLQDATSHRLLSKAYGKDFRIAPGRGNYRQAPLHRDMNQPNEKLVIHKDYPQWIRSKTAKVEVVTAKCPPNKLAWVLIDQAEFHGIPVGGNCVGWSVSGKSPQGFHGYLQKVETHQSRLRSGQLKSVNHDKEGHQANFTALDALIYDFCKASRPHLYESGKTVQAPHSMAASKYPIRQHRYLTRTAFARIRNKQECDSNAIIMKRLEKRGLAYAFERAAQAGPWNVDPSSFSDEALLRFFGIKPQQKVGTTSKKKRKRAN